MKADLGIVAMRPVEKELKLVEEIIAKNGAFEPNIVINVYKNRGGNYPPVRIFGIVNLGNMKFSDLFVTDWNYKQINVSRANLKALSSQLEEQVHIDEATGEIIEEEPKQRRSRR